MLWAADCSRTLWQKLLTFNKSMLASNSLVASAANLTDSIQKITQTASLEEVNLTEFEATMLKALEITKIRAQLQDMKNPSTSQGMTDIQQSVDDLKSWASKVLCPDLAGMLTSLATEAEALVPIPAPDATTQAMADAFSGQLPNVPESITRVLRLRCLLAALYQKT